MSERVIFNNIDSSLVDNFVSEQDKLIDEAKTNYEFWKEDDFASLPSNVSLIASSNIWYHMNGSILTVYYEITIEAAIGSFPSIAVINIDLENKRLVTDEELLKLADTSFDDIVLGFYNKTLDTIKICNEPE